MANYNINKSDGTPFTINTGTINNTFDVPFVGQDAINYGDDLARANLRLLENFANVTPPTFGTTRTRGQLWYDTTPSTGRLNVYDGTSWDIIPLNIDVVHISGAEVIAGIKTFSSAPDFTSAGAGFTIANNTEITNLNAEFVGGLTASAFATSAQGILADNAEPDLLLPPVNGYVLASDMAGNRSWVSLALSSGQVNVNPGSIGPTVDTTTNVMLVGDTTDGLQDARFSAGLTYNANTGVLTSIFAGTFSGSFSGPLSGNATTATTATTATNVTVGNEAADTTCFPLFVTAATGGLGPKTNASLAFNSSTGVLTGIFSGSGALITALNLSSGTHTGLLSVVQGGTGVGTSTGSGSVVRNGSPTFTTKITAPIVDNPTGLALQTAGVTQVVLQTHTTLGATTGAQVKAHTGTTYDIGFNTLPQYNWETSGTTSAEYCGHVTGASTTGGQTLTTEVPGTLDFPIGGITTIVNGDNLDYNVVEGAGSQINYLEPGVGISDTTGGVTIGPGGVATLYRFDATVWYIWGSEISYTP